MNLECELLQFLSRSEPLMKMVEHAFRMWVASSVCADQNHWWEWTPSHSVCESLSMIEQIGMTEENGWTNIQDVSVWADQNHWQEQLNSHLVCELLFIFEQIRAIDESGWTCIQNVSYTLVFEQIRTIDKNGWPCIQYVSCSPVLSRSEPLIRVAEHAFSLWVVLYIGTTDKGSWTYTGSESISAVWVDQNHWWEWLNTYPGSELLSSVWADLNHWQEWSNPYPACESFSSVWEDQNHWTCMQKVSFSPLSEQIRTVDKNPNTPSDSELLSSV